MFASTATDAAILIAASAAAIATIIGSVVAALVAFGQANRERALDAKVDVIPPVLDAIHEGVTAVLGEVQTLNGSTVGQLADQGETRRVGEIPPADRTRQEQEHIAIIPPDK